jgi:signal transduction histidine kinase
VEQILLNLLSNAIKFSPSGSVVTVSAAPAGEQVRLQVRDAGSGIPADKLDSVFEPFVQVGLAESGERRGTGLGLTISRELARAMAGDLAVESTLGAGSTFSLTLPRAD